MKITTVNKNGSYKTASDKEEHPLDRKTKMFGVECPEENYCRRVWANLVNIICEENKISEKDFSNQETAQEKVKDFLYKEKITSFIFICENEKRRPNYCAEVIFEKFKKDLEL